MTGRLSDIQTGRQADRADRLVNAKWQTDIPTLTGYVNCNKILLQERLHQKFTILLPHRTTAAVWNTHRIK